MTSPAYNVIPINTSYVPATCDGCGVNLEVVYHPHHFRTHLELEPNGTRRSVTNQDAPFRDRGVIIAAIPVDGEAVFYATTDTQRASVRGTAYGWARLHDATMRAKRLCAQHVRITRIA